MLGLFWVVASGVARWLLGCSGWLSRAFARRLLGCSGGLLGCSGWLLGQLLGLFWVVARVC